MPKTLPTENRAATRTGSITSNSSSAHALKTEFALDLLRETGDVDPALVIQACNLVGATQLLNALLDHGGRAVKKLLLDKPQTYISILNVICRLADSGLRYDKHRRLLDQQQRQSS